MTQTPRYVLPIIVLAQFAGTSLWFAVNAVMPDLQIQMGWPASDVGRLTSALQLGFIAGTLVFAVLAIADRFSSRRVFLMCSLAGSLCTLGGSCSSRQFCGTSAVACHYRILPCWHLPRGNEVSLTVVSQRTWRCIGLAGWGLGFGLGQCPWHSRLVKPIALV